MKIIVTPDDWSNARIVPSAELATAIGALAPGRYELAWTTPHGGFEVNAVPEEPAPVDPVDPIEPEPVEPEQPEIPVEPAPVEPPGDPLPPIVAPGGIGGAWAKITMRRGDQRVAPEGIAFFAEVGGFNAQPPVEGTVRNPLLHDLDYFWTFGDPGQFRAPRNIVDGWKDQNWANSPFPAHVFAKGGKRVVVLMVRERSSGKVAWDLVEVETADPRSVFTPATRIVVGTSKNCPARVAAV